MLARRVHSRTPIPDIEARRGVGINQPINMPLLDHIDVIGGKVTGYQHARYRRLRG